MTVPLGHEQAQELLGAFALDALDPDEAEAVAGHLLACARCQAEVADFRQAASLLAFEGTEAPPDLWDKIASSLEEQPPPLALARVVPLRPSWWQVAGVRLVVAAAVMISLLALGVSFRAGSGSDGGGSGSGSDDLAAEIAAMALDPDTRHVRLVGAAGTGDSQLSADVLLLADHAMFARDSLPPLGEGETYQLWGLRGDSAVSLGVLGADPGPAPLTVGASFDALAITVERMPGAVAPSRSPLVVGEVPTSA